MLLFTNVFFQSVLVDMEEGVVKGLLRSPLGGLFDVSHLVTDFPGSANNWFG